jgi:hypothetical protein
MDLADLQFGDLGFIDIKQLSKIPLAEIMRGAISNGGERYIPSKPVRSHTQRNC